MSGITRYGCQICILGTVHNKIQNIEQNMLHMMKYSETVRTIFFIEFLHSTLVLKINISFQCNARHKAKKGLIQKQYKGWKESCFTSQ